MTIQYLKSQLLGNKSYGIQKSEGGAVAVSREIRGFGYRNNDKK
jgi:hypothetical protein